MISLHPVGGFLKYWFLRDPHVDGWGPDDVGYLCLYGLSLIVSR